MSYCGCCAPAVQTSSGFKFSLKMPPVVIGKEKKWGVVASASLQQAKMCRRDLLKINSDSKSGLYNSRNRFIVNF
jgi:hypothetical protein